MRLIGLIFTLGGALVWSVLAVNAQNTPKIGGVVNYVASSGTVSVNGIPVKSFSVEEHGSGGSGMDLTDWLVNGSNEIVLTVVPVNERGKATLELQDFMSGDGLLKLEQEGAGEQRGTFETEGLPEWSFLKATPQGDNSDGLAEAVAALHKAYGAKDLDAIVTISAPFFADQGLMQGMTAEFFRDEAGPMLQTGDLQPLQELTITSHQGGKVFHVLGADGNPPIAVLIEEDGMKGALRTGEWWSMIDGAWRVVR